MFSLEVEAAIRAPTVKNVAFFRDEKLPVSYQMGWNTVKQSLVETDTAFAMMLPRFATRKEDVDVSCDASASVYLTPARVS